MKKCFRDYSSITNNYTKWNNSAQNTVQMGKMLDAVGIPAKFAPTVEAGLNGIQVLLF